MGVKLRCFGTVPQGFVRKYAEMDIGWEVSNVTMETLHPTMAAHPVSLTSVTNVSTLLVPQIAVTLSFSSPRNVKTRTLNRAMVAQRTVELSKAGSVKDYPRVVELCVETQSLLGMRNVMMQILTIRMSVNLTVKSTMNFQVSQPIRPFKASTLLHNPCKS